MENKKLVFDKNIIGRKQTRYVGIKKNKLRDEFKDDDTLEKLKTTAIGLLKSKKDYSNVTITAIRLLLHEKAEEIDSDKFSSIDLDKEFIKEATKNAKEKNIDIEMQGQWPRKRSPPSRDEQEEPSKKEQIIEEEEEEKPVTEEMDGVEEQEEESKKRPRQEEEEQEPEQDVDVVKEQPIEDEEEEEEILEEESTIAQPPTEIAEEETKEEEEEEEEPLPEIDLTHPHDIVETTTPQVEQPIQEVVLEDSDVLPSGAVPEGEDQAVDETPTIDPATLGDPAALEEQGIPDVEDDELPDYEDIESEDEDQVSPISSEGFDNQGNPVVINYEPSDIEIQSMIVDVLIEETRPFMDSDQQARDFVVEMLQQNVLEIPKEEEQEKQETVKEVEDIQVEQEETKEQQPMDVEDMDVQDIPPKEPITEQDVVMKEPSKQQQREILKQQKQAEKQAKLQQQKDAAMSKLHSEIFGQKPTSIITEEDEDKIESQKSKNVKVRDYIAKIALKHISDIKESKASFTGQIKAGHAKSAFELRVATKPVASKEINLEISAQVKKEIETKMRLRSSDILTEVADYTARNVDRIKQGLDPSNAISRYIYPTFRDPDTFNVVKYRSDADGNVIINRETGQPIIESISAVDRDDSRKFMEQKQAVDATDTPSPYYPIYGKQARRFFSKNEYNYLGRMFQGPGGKARASVPKPLQMKQEISTMLSEMSDALELKDTSIKSNKFKQWSELQILKSSFHRYNQFADYQYTQDKKELQQDGTLVDPDATESAAKLLQNITVQKLLDLLAAQQQEKVQAFKQAEQPISNVSDLKQETPQLGPNEMDIEKQPENVGADIPQEEETKEQEINLNNWATTQSSSFSLPTQKLYRYSDSFPAFGGDSDTLKDL